MADVQLPRWQWDAKVGALVPVCPRCGGPVMVDTVKMTCHIMGYSHYGERLADVLDLTEDRLAEA